ncbi:uncharacterized protein METZ01_LOCUS228213 [marine metagenome]|uniref:Uncharacterized protein n=1 Tax=marine metagenome TaxID=408172 RepID=A0A382GK75_9ZZZZ
MATIASIYGDYSDEELGKVQIYLRTILT